MRVSTHTSSVPTARAEVHEDHGQVFIEYYDSNGNLTKRAGGYTDVNQAQNLAESWATSLQTLLG